MIEPCSDYQTYRLLYGTYPDYTVPLLGYDARNVCIGLSNHGYVVSYKNSIYDEAPYVSRCAYAQLLYARAAYLCA